MVRGGLILAALAASLLLAGPRAVAAAAVSNAVTTKLLPGLEYMRELREIEGRQVVVHVLTAPRPGGIYELRPILSNDLIQERETVTAMQQRLAGTATVAGVNGDLFNWTTGHPSGIYLRDGVLRSRPAFARSSLGIGLDGLLRVARIEFFGSWRVGELEKHPLVELNRPIEAKNAVGLFTPAWGPATPTDADAVDVVLSGFPELVPNSDLIGQIAEVRFGGGTAIPPGGAVVQAHGFWGDRLAFEALPGLPLAVHLALQPWWEGIRDAIGGGPVIVQDGQPIPEAGENFRPSQLRPRHPRTAVGQLPDGRVILVAIDGRRSWSAGVTVSQLAQEMVRLGAVTAFALDAGGSTTVAFDGQVLNSPSDGHERGVGDALMVLYYGAYAPPPRFPVVSPNGDGFADFQELSYKIVLASTVNISLIAPDGTVVWHDEGPREPGVYPLALSSQEGQPPLAEGRWRWVVAATDGNGNPSGLERRFSVNNTLGTFRLSRRRLPLLPKKGGTLRLRFAVAHRARVLATVEDAAGEVVRKLVNRIVAEPGKVELLWDGRDVARKLVSSGRYRLRVISKNELGRAELFGDVIVERMRPPAKPAE